MNSRTTNPDTSRIAAKNHKDSGNLESNRAACLAIVLFYPGLTAVEIAVKAGIDRHEASRRLPELEEDGQVRKGPKRKCRIKGTQMVTWEKVSVE